MSIQRTQKMLSGLLLAQVVLAGLTWMPSGSATVAKTKLLPAGGNSVTKITVTRSGDDAKAVELTSENGAWAITSEHGYPADGDKVAEMVDALAKIELGEPVATQATSYDKLKVSDAGFGKKVTFTADGKEHTLLVGSAASKAVYLRVDGGEDVYMVKGFSEFVFKDSARSFWKTNYVEFSKDDATSFTLSRDAWSLSFERHGEGWALTGGQPGMLAVSDKVAELVGKAAALRLGEPVGKEVLPEHGLAAGTPGALRVDWAAKTGEQTTTGSFTLGAEKDGKFYAQAQGNPFVVLVPKYAVQALKDATPETLTSATGEAPAPDAAGGPPGGMPPGMPPGMMPPGMPPGMMPPGH